MLDFIFATAHAYDYNYTDAESLTIAFALHEVTGEPGSYRITANAYRTLNGQFVGEYFDHTVDVLGVRDMETAVNMIFACADECILETARLHDVFYRLVGIDGATRYMSMRGIGRTLMLDAFKHEGVDCYPLTEDDLDRIAATR